MNQEINLLSDDELDAVTGGARVEWGEVPCPVGHLTVVTLYDGGQKVTGVSYHL